MDAAGRNALRSPIEHGDAMFGTVTPLYPGIPSQSRRSKGEWSRLPVLNSSIRFLSSARSVLALFLCSLSQLSQPSRSSVNSFLVGPSKVNSIEPRVNRSPGRPAKSSRDDVPTPGG